MKEEGSESCDSGAAANLASTDAHSGGGHGGEEGKGDGSEIKKEDNDEEGKVRDFNNTNKQKCSFFLCFNDVFARRIIPIATCLLWLEHKTTLYFSNYFTIILT